MPINFHATENRESYASREADHSWVEVMRAIVTPDGKRVYDIGCGGGIYSRAWRHMGAREVVGVDFSAVMIEAAREHSIGLANVSFTQGDATRTGLPDASAEVVFERALLHHVPDADACYAEAFRLLAPGGTYIAQDKTAEDIRQPASPEYIGGYIFERFPRLIDVEVARRPRSAAVRAGLERAGFAHVDERRIWETHTEYPSIAALATALRARTGRSIAHELSDAEVEELIAYVRERVPTSGPITERVPWTLWWAVKPER